MPEFAVRAVVKDAGVIGNISYKWTVSSGTIVKGQDAETVFVDTSGEEGGKNITVKVTVSGLPGACQNIASDLVGIGPIIGCIFPIDQFNNPSANETKARIDNIFIQLNNSPTMIALFEMEFGDAENRPERILRLTRILDAIKTRKYDVSRVAFLISDKEGDSTSVIFLPLTADMSVWINQGTLIYGQDMKQKLSTLFRNK